MSEVEARNLAPVAYYGATQDFRDNKLYIKCFVSSIIDSVTDLLGAHYGIRIGQLRLTEVGRQKSTSLSYLRTLSENDVYNLRFAGQGLAKLVMDARSRAYLAAAFFQEDLFGLDTDTYEKSRVCRTLCHRVARHLGRKALAGGIKAYRVRAGSSAECVAHDASAASDRQLFLRFGAQIEGRETAFCLVL
ncbi:hypothetical protein [Porphyrobacter sp. GA68]|uniref:hypothetical protein n=1 Tax=Porphyrobacter sp. GA68 TaxID=2883480 RepID=UPI001D1984D4|nr:hypothetical protein [Porphyrobacter sp. GA68]